MPTITLTTDFGTQDFYAGALKGTFLQFCSNTNIVDISHQISKFNITEAAFVLKNSFAKFPDGTVHVVWVNDYQDDKSRVILVKYCGHYFMGFDNGLFSLAFDDVPDEAYELYTFSSNGVHGTSFLDELYAKAASHLVEGKAPAELGRQIFEIQQRTNLQPVIQDTLIRGTVIYVDSFQNAVVNITKELFDEVKGNRKFVLFFKRDERIEEISYSYFDVPEGEKLCIFNSSGYMEIAINKGKASSLLGLGVGDTIQIDFE